MPFNYKEKVKVVKLVKEEHLSYLKAGKAIGASKTVVLEWVKLFEKHGFEALKEKTSRKTYLGEFKLNVIKYMHDNHLSCYTVAAKFNVARTQIQRWERIYYEEGTEALLQERRGRPQKMKQKSDDKTCNENKQEDLIAEVQQLRMENEYLKKLNALVQKHKKLKNGKKRKSSAN